MYVDKCVICTHICMCVISVYKSMADAMKKHSDADVLINFASLRSAYDSTIETLAFPQVRWQQKNHNNITTFVYGFMVTHMTIFVERIITERKVLITGCHLSLFFQIRTIAIIAEGIPENLTRILIKKAGEKGVSIIGPATVGGIKPGCFKIGNTGGMMDNILHSKLYRPGR